MEQLATRFPVPPRTPFAVVGLGKLGGEELNYSSDIDLLFVYGEEGECEEGGSYHAFFNKLGERVVQNLSRSTAEGHLYRVDMRLRPESGAGPLARSLGSYLFYYESRGELWERQMLLKARPVGGDLRLGEDFLRGLEPFVFPRTLFHNPAESVARVKARIETTMAEDDNIKLRRGGIRDIEFLVQTLQLVHGGRMPQVRTGNTLTALRELARGGLLAADEADMLADAYTFFRIVEHRLQMMLNTQTHILPTGGEDQERLARSLGMSGAEELLRRLHSLFDNVRRLFDRVIAAGQEVAEEGIIAVIEGGLPEEAVHRVLGTFGFIDVKQATRHVQQLSTGSGLTDLREFDTRTRDAFRQVAPSLFEEIGGTPNPDITLGGLAAVAGTQAFPAQFFQQLADPAFRKFLVRVCAVSPRVSRELAADALLLEALASHAAGLADPQAGALPAVDDLMTFRRHQEIRAIVRHLLGFSDFDAFTEDLSGIAEFVVRRVMEESGDVRRPPFVVLALGKFGTRELTVGSDLDLVFFGSPRTPKERDLLERRAGAVVKRLTAATERGHLYAVDARLRPEGKSAPLVVDVDQFAQYLRERATLWERQAMTRARVVAGDPELGRRALLLIHEHITAAPLPKGWVKSAMDMRRRMEQKSRFASSDFVDIKVGPGGMVDVEFLAQLFLIGPGRDRRELRGIRTVDVLPYLVPQFLSPARCDEFTRAYRFARDIEKFIRVALEERTTILPEGRNLRILARLLGFRTGEELERSVRSSMKQTRMLFLESTMSLGGGQ
jgi:glutamate-ammonia-ligase adenylyltransferase